MWTLSAESPRGEMKDKWIPVLGICLLTGRISLTTAIALYPSEVDGYKNDTQKKKPTGLRGWASLYN
jgi:hypothetical protein